MVNFSVILVTLDRMASYFFWSNLILFVAKLGAIRAVLMLVVPDEVWRKFFNCLHVVVILGKKLCGGLRAAINYISTSL